MRAHAPAVLLFLAALPAQNASYLAHVAAAEASLRLGELASFRKWLERAPAAARGFEWRWLDSLRDQSSLTLATGEVLGCIDVSPDGALLAAGGLHGAVEIRAASTGNLVLRLAGHGGEVYRVRFDAAGKRIVTASHDRKVRVWDVATGAQLVEFGKHGYPVGGAAFSPDGTFVASCSYERPPGTVVGTVHVWRAADGELLRTLQGGRKPLSEICFSPDGKVLAAGSWDFCVFLWDAEHGGEPRKLAMPDEGRYNAVDAVAFSPDGTRIAAASKDDTARIWDVASGELTATLRGHGNYVGALRFSPDGGQVATCSSDETLRLWDARDGTLRAILRGHQGPVRAVGFTADGARLWSTGDDQRLRCWDARTGWYGQTTLKTSAAAYSCVWSSDGTRLASCSYDGRVQLWDTQDWTELASWQAHPRESSCHALAFSPDGKRIYSGSYDKSVAIWDASTLAEIGRLQHDSGIYVLRLAPDGKSLACGLMDGKVLLWDLGAREVRCALAPGGGGIQDLAFSPDSATLAIATRTAAVSLWEAADGAALGSMEGPKAVARSCAFAPGGRLVTGDGSGIVRVWDLAGRRETASTHCFNNGIARISIGPDGKRAAAVARDVAIVDLDAVETTLLLRPHRESMWFCEWAPHGEVLATVAMDGTLAVLDPAPLAGRLVLAGAYAAAREQAATRIATALAAGKTLAELAEAAPVGDPALRAELTRRFAQVLTGEGADRHR